MSTNQPRKPAGTPAGGQWAPTTHAETDIDLSNVTSLDIRRTTNMFGELSEQARRRLEAVVEAPSEHTWDQAHSLVLNGRTGITLWEAVCIVDPLFPTRKYNGRWSSVPSHKTLLAAINRAVYPPVVTCDLDPGRPNLPYGYHHGPHEQALTCRNPRQVQS